MTRTENLRFYAKEFSTDHRFFKRELKEFNKQQWKELQEINKENSKIYYDEEDFEGCTEVKRFHSDELYSYEDRKEIAQEFEVTINSPYDCTGKRFTRWVDCFQAKNGNIFVVIHWGLDV